jgi:hypothetical protein
MGRSLYGWEFVFRCQREWWRYDRGWWTLSFGVVKRIAVPPDGEYLRHGKHYHGFLFEMNIFVPIEIKQWR